MNHLCRPAVCLVGIAVSFGSVGATPADAPDWSSDRVELTARLDGTTKINGREVPMVAVTFRNLGDRKADLAILNDMGSRFDLEVTPQNEGPTEPAQTSLYPNVLGGPWDGSSWPIDLPPGQTYRYRFPLHPWADMTTPGTYQVVVRYRIPFANEYPKTFQEFKERRHSRQPAPPTIRSNEFLLTR